MDGRDGCEGCGDGVSLGRVGGEGGLYCFVL